MKIIAPRGWTPGLIEKRFVDIAPSSYDADARTVECVISRGSPVQRFYGIEILRIDRNAIIIDRLISTGIPFLDSHQQVGIDSALGKFTRIWFPGDGSLVGKVRFNDTPKGRLAAGMIGRGEVGGVSAGYRVLEWLITDEDGNVIDPEADIRWDDTGLTFEAVRWELLEVSAVLIAADASASIRSHSSNDRSDREEVYNAKSRAEVRARMRIRQRMHDRQQDFDKLH